jgi:hypothetical protein
MTTHLEFQKLGDLSPRRVGEFFLGFDGFAGTTEGTGRYLMRLWYGKAMVLSRFPKGWTLEQCAREVRRCNESAWAAERQADREAAN